MFCVANAIFCRAQNLVDPTNIDWCKPELCDNKKFTHIACKNDKVCEQKTYLKILINLYSILQEIPQKVSKPQICNVD